MKVQYEKDKNSSLGKFISILDIHRQTFLSLNVFEMIGYPEKNVFLFLHKKYFMVVY